MNTVGLVIYPSPDLAHSTKYFATLLDTQPYAESAYYVGFKAGDVEIGLVPKAAQRVTGVLAYVDVKDIRAAVATLLAAGAEKVQDVTDVANGLLVASVKGPDGNTLGLRQFPNA